LTSACCERTVDNMEMDKLDKDVKLVMSDISLKIKYLRNKKNMSVNALAKKTGLAGSYLSQIENQKRVPAIGTLVNIARALGVDVFYLVNGEKPVDQKGEPFIVRATERRLVTLPFRSFDSTYESVNYKAKNDRLMDGYILTAPDQVPFEPKTEERAHEGEELIFILQGTQELLYNGKSYILEEGDCCYFDSNKPHNARSVGDMPSKALVVFATRNNT